MELKILYMVRSSEVVLRCLLQSLHSVSILSWTEKRHVTDYSLKSKSGFSLDQGLQMNRNIPDHYPSAAVKLIFVVGNL